MSLAIAKQKRGERKKIVDQMNAMIPVDGVLTPEIVAKHGELDAEQEKLRGEIEVLEKQDDLNKQMNNRVDRVASRRGVPADQVREENRELSDAFGAWMRKGASRLTEEQRSLLAGSVGEEAITRAGFQNAQSTVDVTEGGALIPESMAGSITAAEKFEGGMIDDGVATVVSTSSGNQVNFPTDNDTNNEGELVNESTSASYQDVAFGSIGVNAHLFSSKIVLIPISLLQDSAFDLNAFVNKKFGQRLGRAKNRQFTLGTGASAPRGIMTVAPVGYTFPAGQTNQISSDDLFQLEHSVDPAYRKNARFMFPDSVLKAIKLMKDGVGRPLWLSGIAVKEPDTINSYQYTINTKMADMATSGKSIAFGDFSLYLIRNVAGMVMLRLVERFAEKGQVGFLVFTRADGQLLDAGTHPVKLGQNSAS